jgi:ubiquitin C-terminal hydrolase
MSTPVETEAYDPALVPKPFGLNNTGAICHQNALLQALVGLSAVVRATATNREYLSKTPTGRAFYDFMWEAVPASREPGSAPFRGGTPLAKRSAELLQALVEDLRARRPKFSFGHSQEDGSEGLVLLLDMIDDPAPGPKDNPIARLFYHRYLATVICRKCNGAVSKQTDVAVTFKLFSNQKCVTPAEFSEDIRQHLSLLKDYSCEECGEKGDCYRKYQLQMIPEVMVTMFNIYGRRNVAHYAPNQVHFPRHGGGSLIYRRVAQIEQFGSLAGGHYIARSLRGDGAVYRFDDASFSSSKLEQTPNVYMVFYHSTDHPQKTHGSGGEA